VKLADKPLYEIGNGRTAGSGIAAVSTAHGIEFVTNQFLTFLHSTLLSSVGLAPVEIMLAAKAKPLNRKTQESRFGQAARSEELADAVSDAAKKAAANGTGYGADAADRRTTHAAGYGSAP
jgi:hypothetical protein